MQSAGPKPLPSPPNAGWCKWDSLATERFKILALGSAPDKIALKGRQMSYPLVVIFCQCNKVSTGLAPLQGGVRLSGTEH